MCTQGLAHACLHLSWSYIRRGVAEPQHREMLGILKPCQMLATADALRSPHHQRMRAPSSCSRRHSLLSVPSLGYHIVRSVKICRESLEYRSLVSTSRGKRESLFFVESCSFHGLTRRLYSELILYSFVS